MLCHNCKEEIYDSPWTCPYCGADVSQPPETPEQAPYYDVITILQDKESQPAATTKSAVAVAEKEPPTAYVSFGQLETENGADTVLDPPYRRLKLRYIILPALVIVAAVVVYVLVLGFLKPDLTSSINALLADCKTRIDSSVLVAGKSIAACAADGEITADISYTDTYGDTFSGTAALGSDSDAEMLSLALNASLYGNNLDATLLLGDDYASLGSSFLGDTFYGLQFDSFGEDFESFANAAGLTDVTSGDFIEFVRFLDDAYNGKEKLTLSQTTRDSLQAIFTGFFTGLEPTETREKLTVGNTRVKRHTNTYHITITDLAKLGNDFIKLADTDKELRQLMTIFMQRRGMVDEYVTSASAIAGSDLYRIVETAEPLDAYLNDLQYAIDFLSSKCTGGFTLALTIDNSRLSAITLDADSLVIDGNAARIHLAFDFGQSVNDDWLLEFTAYGENISFSMRATAAFYDENGAAVNRLTVNMLSGGIDETMTFTSKWAPDTGKFSLSLISTNSDNNIGLRGTMRYTGDSFVISFETTPQLSLQITGKTGFNLKTYDYINLDKWNRDTLELFTGAYKEFYDSIYSYSPGNLPRDNTDIILIS